jgi:DNA-binding CsgD family transcriptional regulator/tetratricopeptide (TPR) repeat protein
VAEGHQSRPEPTPPTAATSRWPLVGRADLLEQVGEALSASHVMAVMLHGPSGVGKTRLADECVLRAVAAGRPALRVVASRTLAQMPLGAVMSPLIGDAFDAGTPDDPVALFAQASRTVKAAGRGRRVILAVDDLPLLDQLSVALVAQLVQAGLVVLLATVRDGDVVPDAFVGLWSSDRAVRVDVPLLSRAECVALLTAVLQAPVGARCAADLHRASGGNPLHLRELVLGARLDATLAQVAGVWRLTSAPSGTPALRDLLVGRLQAVDADGRALLERLALCQPLNVDELPSDRDRAALVRLDEAGLIRVEQAGGRLAVRLTHPQYANVVRSRLSRVRAADLLLEQATLLEERGGGAPGDALRVALWRLEAVGTADPALLVRAARLARAAHDYAAVLRLAGAAAAGADTSAHGAEVLLLLGEAQREAGQPAEALATLARAAALPTSAQLSARIATVRAATLGYQQNRTDDALAVLREAQRAVPEQATRLATVAAALLGSADRTTEALAELDAAGEPDGLSPAEVVQWAIAAVPALAAAGRAGEAVQAAERGVAASRDTDANGPLHRSGPLMVHAVALGEAGRVTEALDVARTALWQAVDDGLDRSVCSAEWRLARTLMLAGKPRSAARWCRDVVSGARAHDLASHLPLGLCGVALASAWLGVTDDVDQACRELDGLGLPAGPDDPWLVAARAWRLVVHGDVGSATASLLAGARRCEERGQLAVAAALLHDVVRLGHPDEAASPLVDLATRCDSRLVAARAMHATAARDRDAVGLVAVADEFADQGAILFAAEAMATAAQAARSSQGGRSASTLRARATALAAQCEGARTPILVTDPVEPLTSREREVALLAARSMTSKEIAARLVLSIRTVDNHLQACYAKLGITSRTELPGALALSGHR